VGGDGDLGLLEALNCGLTGGEGESANGSGWAGCVIARENDPFLLPLLEPPTAGTLQQ